jgi:uncharacterized protein (DUF427 family)
MIPKRIEPGPGQESVWDYPRPPRLEKCSKHIQVVFNDVVIVDSLRAWRVLETSHPPVYYSPPEDIRMEFLTPVSSSTLCEWKGQARYFDLRVGERLASRAAWCYPNPDAAFESIRNYLAFYAGPMDACLVDGERARPQPGSFYGGWITSDVVGPFKGEPGTMGW